MNFEISLHIEPDNEILIIFLPIYLNMYFGC